MRWLSVGSSTSYILIQNRSAVWSHDLLCNIKKDQLDRTDWINLPQKYKNARQPTKNENETKTKTATGGNIEENTEPIWCTQRGNGEMTEIPRVYFYSSIFALTSALSLHDL